MSEESRFTIQLDTGGTFTDGYVSSAKGAVRSKVDTTPHDPAEGILKCIDHAATLLGLDRALLLRKTDVVRLSTTLGTNILINRDGAKIGLLVDAGVSQAIEGRLPQTLPLAEGLTQVLPDADAADSHARTVACLRRLLERGARILVIALSGGPDLAQRERGVRGLIASEYPRHYLGAVPVVPSHEVTLAPDPVIRVCTAVVDAYLHPVMSRFLYRVEDQLRDSGYQHPLLIAQSNGGSSRIAKTTAIRTWGSGPAGGVSGAAALAQALDLDAVVAVDVGGTSSDVTVIEKGQWTYSVQPDIEGIRVSLPVLELDSVGIGGGSISNVTDGNLGVGPRSAGAQPGPAAFGLGGTNATVTDAACALGWFDPSHYLGGRKTLDVAAARAVIDEMVAGPLGLDTADAARRILDQAASTVASDVRKLLDRRRLSSKDAWLFATGGAGGLIAAGIARHAGLKGFMAFPLSPVFSAFGLSRLDLLHVYETEGGPHARAALEELKRRAVRDMRGEGADISRIGYTLELETPGTDRVAAQVRDLGDAQDLDAAIGRIPKGGGAHLLRLKAVVPGHRHPLAELAGGQRAANGSRAVAWTRSPEPTPVYEWDGLAAGTAFAGPAIVESSDTTIPIPPGHRVSVGSQGELRVTAGGA